MKRIILLLFSLALLTACGVEEKPEETPTDDRDVGGTIVIPEGEAEKDSGDEEPDTEADKPPVDESGEGNDEEQDEAEADAPESEGDDLGNKVDEEDSEQLVKLTFDFFEAMENENFEFIEAILAEGATFSRETKIFTFDNVMYPHEQELITNDTAADIEHRYTDDENPAEVIVGFAAVDYVNEYSYVIDFEYVIEDGFWKINDMDINK